MSVSNRNALIIAVVAAIFFIPFLGGVHLFDWDEINFAEIAREMVELKTYLRIHVNYILFTEKPPLFFWMQAGAMNLFGVGDYAARFPNAICGIVTLVSLYKIGEKLRGVRFGWLWVGAYFGSILPNLYFKSGIIDPWFNYFIFMGIYHLILFHWKKNGIEGVELPRKKMYYLIIAALFTGLGILTKGPVAYLITGLTLGVYWISQRFKFYINAWEVIVYTVLALCVTLMWFGVEFLANGPKFVVEFTVRQWEIFSRADAGHAGFPGYHFVVILIGCFPISIFLIRSHGKLFLEKLTDKDFRKWMLMLFWVVLILFTVVRSKIVHYSSMTYFPMTFLAALVLENMLDHRITFTRWMKGIMLGLAIVMGGIVIALPFVGMNVDWIKPLFQADKFALANLNAEVPWTGLEATMGVLLIGITVAFIVLYNKRQTLLGIKVLLGGTGVFVFFTLILVIGKIERISQRAAITFYEEKANCDCYVEPEGFKSYGQLFYTRRSPDLIPEEHLNTEYKHWVLYGDIDKDAYFVSKVTTDKKLRENPEMEFLYEENGFTFWKRSAKK
tara:strand:- start:907 stop:2580 length:1674 start_codon:yes stop_codon:yes gene_type:complete